MSASDDDFRTRLAVQERLVDYWWDVDANDAKGALDFYTADCVYSMLEHRMDGPAAVADYYAYRASRGARLVRHVLTNLRTRVTGADTASVAGILTVYAADGVPVLPSNPPILVADNTADFVRGDDGAWRMRLHRITALFRGGVPVLVPPGAASGG
ncbi:nuclear transport factor 2 family protein [Piscinibacter koreensis]|uniref:Nuclear transport factor 2 family protein n=1 Tax=Piscinibacter koreensis TaxID=2742824 RepID=A0A7Y6TX37_9BURK|nr:nuclear transport factor 2 family protein [Schlegelella koreensis]NUZ06621.1 nuclear transport factor 2 family protein [Schlegelella koreensis]